MAENQTEAPQSDAEVPKESTWHPSRIAFQHRDFRWFQLARLLNVIASEMLALAVGWQLYELTNRALDLGYAGLAQFLPAFFLILAAGHVADRFDRRAILLVCFTLYFAGAGILLYLTLTGNRATMPIFAVLLMFGTVRSFSGPSAQALMPQIVPPEHFPNAVTWAASTFQAGTILGPALGGVIYAATKGAAWVYGVALAFYLIAWTCIFVMHVRTGRMEKKDISMETLLAGFKFVWRQKIVLGCISLDLFAVLLGGATALLPIFAKEILAVGPWGLGILRSAPAVGAVLMAYALSHHPMRKSAGLTMLWCVAGFGAATVVFGISKSFALSLVALFIVGATDMVSMIVRGTLVQLYTPPEMRGRVSAVNLLFIGASNEFGQFESGVTAHWWGAVTSVVVGGIGSIAVVLMWAWGFPEIRKVETLGKK